jgi:hypothetical protein
MSPCIPLQRYWHALSFIRYGLKSRGSVSKGRALFLLYPEQTDSGVQPTVRPVITVDPAWKQHEHDGTGTEVKR